MTQIIKNCLLAALLTALTVYVSEPAQAKAPTRFDSEICKQSARYLVGHDCDWLKAQLIQESALNPNARSPVGAMGLGQIMPATFRQVCVPLVICHISPYNPEASIKAAAYYQARMESKWISKRSDYDRKALGQASYNAGAGNIIKAQRVCGMPSKYQCIIECLPQVTGRHSVETINYVRLIARHYMKLKAGSL
jgi:soluble lytic murein transglycosylase-like protein